VDVAYPLSPEDGPLRGVPHVMKSIAWAAQIGYPCVDTTDGRHQPEGLSDAGVPSIECEGQAGPMIEQALAWLRRTLQELNIPETT
jgi:hypothetical protein